MGVAETYAEYWPAKREWKIEDDQSRVFIRVY